MSKTKIVLKLSRLTVPQKIEKARFIVKSMTANAYFTTPTPALADITASIDALETASIEALGGGKDNKALVLAKGQILDLQLIMLATYVETVANAEVEVEADYIALSSGMDIKIPSVRSANGFYVENSNPGEVKINAEWIPRVTFRFQMSTTPTDESTYQTIGESTRSRMVMSGLKSGVRYFFRVCTIGKDGPVPWSKPYDLVVT